MIPICHKESVAEAEHLTTSLTHTCIIHIIIHPIFMEKIPEAGKHWRFSKNMLQE
jgi:predicted ester cyclase